MSLFTGNEEIRKVYEEKIFNYLRADFLRKNFGSPDNVQKNFGVANQLLENEDKRLKNFVSGLSDQELLDYLKRADTHIPS